MYTAVNAQSLTSTYAIPAEVFREALDLAADLLSETGALSDDAAEQVRRAEQTLEDGEYLAAENLAQEVVDAAYYGFLDPVLTALAADAPVIEDDEIEPLLRNVRQGR